MNRNLDRIIRGYKPKSESSIYWLLYYILQLTALAIVFLRANIKKILKTAKVIK